MYPVSEVDASVF